MEQTDAQPIHDKRKVRKIGGSLNISVPKEWADQHGIKDGDVVDVIANRHLKVFAPGDPTAREAVRRMYEIATEVVAEDVIQTGKPQPRKMKSKEEAEPAEAS